MKHIALLVFCTFNLITTVLSSCELPKHNGTNSYSPKLNFYNGLFYECGCNITTTTNSTNTNVCIRKCCDVDFILINKMCVVNSTVKLKVPVFDKTKIINSSSIDFRFVTGMVKCEGTRSLAIGEFGYYNLQRDGKLWETELEVFHRPDQYCFENLDGYEAVLVCYDVKDSELKETGRKLNSIGMIISLPFLLITFLVYAILPDRNLHGMCLMFNVFALFLGYLLLIIITNVSNEIDYVSCKSIGTFCLFFFIVSFFWMNVMSIDICWTFSGSRGFPENKKEAERKQFYLYSSYAWGGPALLVILITCLSTKAYSKMWYYPGIGDGQCFVKDGYPMLLYFYGPIAILLIINTILFIVTTLKIKRIQKDTAVLRDENKRHCHESEKKRFGVYLKLLLLMGLNWSMEIISWAVEWKIGNVPPAVWYLTDFINALYGVIIFFMFVFKKSIWRGLKKRFFLVMRKAYVASSTS